MTVATELPVFLDREGAEHMQTELGFDLPFVPERAVTGHIDLVQVRNGAVHVLDYKPGARKENGRSKSTSHPSASPAVSRQRACADLDILERWLARGGGAGLRPRRAALGRAAPEGA